MRKGFVRRWALFSVFAFVVSGCSRAPSGTAPLRILLDQAPATLNPRFTIDAVGQRINALLFGALTRIDADLNAQPDLAESWEVLDSGKLWRFTLREGLQDHSGQSIDAGSMTACLENYRQGKPISPLRGGFPNWESTTHENRRISIRLKAPDPYLSRNLSLLRYFRTANSHTPCAEPERDEPLVTSGLFRPVKWNLAPDSILSLLPVPPGVERRPVEFHFVHDENTKALKLLRGEVDVIQNALALTKTRWIERNYSDRFRILERDGVSVSYLAFNFRDPVLARKEIRQAISYAIDRESIVKNKMFGYCKIAGSFLSPLLPESRESRFEYNPAKSVALLERAGYKPDSRGVRLTLRYKSTPTREGIETALLFQNALQQVGIQILIDVVEPAVFLASVKKGAFQLYSARWLGVADASILYGSLHTGHPQNRIGYSNPEFDRLLEKAISEPVFEKRLPLVQRIQREMAEELIYFPLWFWDSAVIIRKDLKGLKASEISLSGALEPITRLR